MLNKKYIAIILMFIPIIINAQWQETNLTDNAGKITGFAKVGSILFASFTALTSDQTGGVYTSNDEGNTWQIINIGITNKSITSIAVIGSTLFISTDGDGILTSTDNGGSWVSVNSGLKSLKVYKIMASGTNLYSGTDDGLYVSANNGLTWTNLTVSVSNQNITAFIATSSTIVFTNRGYPNYYYSTDGGSTWSDAITGLPMGTSNCYAQSGNEILTGTLNGIYSSSDNGASWKSLGVTGSIYSIADVGGNLFSGTDVLKGISYSADDGKTWTVNNDGIDLLDLTINAIFFNGNDVLIGSTNSSIFKRSIYELGLTDVEDFNSVPVNFNLYQNYPNPFNPTTVIKYSIPSNGKVTLKIYDVSGNEISTLVDAFQNSGEHIVNLNADNLSSGVYYSLLQYGTQSISKKLLLLK
jgi:hypothetical protein